jgi:hypothetical protein
VLLEADIHLLDQLAPFGNFGLDVLATAGNCWEVLPTGSDLSAARLDATSS